jgi:oligo-1,6-glucosidase
VSSPLRAPGWWKSAVVYQVYPRSFMDSDGDGVGDLPGITSRLDHLGTLGVDVLWLSPVYRSPMDDNGYDISDYEDVDPLFGTLADLDALVAGCHERSIRVVMDLVVNHTSDEHPWFVESRDPASPKRDWYWWRPPRADGSAPTNWESFFGGSAWEYDDCSGEYYLHLFSRKQPDLDWENPEVRRAVHAMMRRWVERGIDGFRMDVIELISKEARLRDGVPVDGHALASPVGVSFGPRLDEFLVEMNHEVGLSAEHLLTVGEMGMSTIEQARQVTDPARGELDMLFSFEHLWQDEVPGQGKWASKPLHLPDLKRVLERWQTGLADTGWNSLYWDNHDQPRVVSRFGDDSPDHRIASAKTLATVLHLHRGTPYVYQGEELGMTNAGFTRVEQYADLESLNWARDALARGLREEEVLRALATKSRDNARTPMQWDASEHAGFTSGTPWLPAHANRDVVNAEAELGDPDSVFHHYRRLIELRHSDDVVVDGRFALLLPDDPAVWAFTRTLGDRVLLVLANLSGDPVTISPDDVPDLSGSQVLLPTHAPPYGSTLRPWESRIERGRLDPGTSQTARR